MDASSSPEVPPMINPASGRDAIAPTAGFDTTSNEEFYEYYKNQSLSPRTMERFRAIAEIVLGLRDPRRSGVELDVLDVGCGAGTQSRFWNENGHRYQGLDINEPLIRLANRRAAEQALRARFEVGTATALPFADGSFDVCLVPELLEHVEDWRSCLEESIRVLRPGGVVFVSTSNRLCPVQVEFRLPGYSWYPAFVKRWVVRRSLTTWPAVANHAKYPAVHWFSFYQLRRFFAERGFVSLDRFDLVQLEGKSHAARWLIGAIRAVPPLRFLGHMLTPSTILVARRL